MPNKCGLEVLPVVYVKTRSIGIVATVQRPLRPSVALRVCNGDEKGYTMGLITNNQYEYRRQNLITHQSDGVVYGATTLCDVQWRM
jgi:hypothetical protein